MKCRHQTYLPFFDKSPRLAPKEQLNGPSTIYYKLFFGSLAASASPVCPTRLMCCYAGSSFVPFRPLRRFVLVSNSLFVPFGPLHRFVR